ncbi:MAG: LutB/LldF family L-lactate oxidation iron-sulfur protein [Alphaproteobacteria bacterium]|nr:LutB/LldF family L-lactate oxidation iron-sulfur protein [Alphaproteobacteria bacterium]
MQPVSHAFEENAELALVNATQRRALGKMSHEFGAKRAKVIARLPEFDALRDQAKTIKDHVLENLDFYLEIFEEKVTASGGHVHWCRTPAEARDAVLALCRDAGAGTVAKGKSMITEEIGLNAYLEANGITPVETDLGEYILQLRGETPSHITAPAVHLNKEQIADAFRAGHTGLDPARPLDEPQALLDEARAMLRDRFIEADVGLTGANFLIAETGSTVIVTNEGNGDLSQTLPKMHIVVASIEKVVPTLEDAATILRLLARSATAQEITSYTTFSTGPKRADDMDGPEAFHVVLLDNGRAELLGGEFRDVLRCIRCGACQSLCPVWGAVGGQAYGWVYGGPIGAVLTPALIGIKEARHLPEASTFCGMCESVCPMRIPLPKLMRRWREVAFEKKHTPGVARYGIGLWALFAKRPALYRLLVRAVIALLARMGARRGRFHRLPLAGGWTAHRDLPAPQGGTFMDQWRSRGERSER